MVDVAKKTLRAYKAHTPTKAARGLHRSASANALLHAGAADSPGRAMLSPPVQRANTFKASVVRVLRV